MKETFSQDNGLPKLEGALVANRYKILSMVGQGGMGEVYKAFDQALNEGIAIKILRPELQMDSQSLQRFKLETKTTRKLRHPNIVGMFDLFWGKDLKFITMEFVEGITLKELITKEGALPVSQTIAIIVQVLRALEEAHRQSVIHRDIKPGNIMLSPQTVTGELRSFAVKVADFGIAKIVSGEAGVTTSGLIMGTPEYMSPEQAQGYPTGPQSDIYSLGIVFYEMLAGSAPFSADTPFATALKHIKDSPSPLRNICPHVPERLERLVMKMLAKRPEERWQTAGEIRELLEKRTSLFLTPDHHLIAQMPSEMDRIRRYEATEGVGLKRKKGEQAASRGHIPHVSTAKREKGFPWKWVAIIFPLIAVFLGIGLFFRDRGLVRMSRSPKNMVLVPAGEFLMGTSQGAAGHISEIFPHTKRLWLKDEQPAQKIYLKAFYIDKYEVSNKEYKRFVESTGCKAPFADEEWARDYNWVNNTYPSGKENHPVVLVTWDDAQSYARWAGKRLPTEAEWEKAARGGSADKLWPWGDELDPRRLNSWEGEVKGTRPVGSYAANAYGIYDVAGNVWEWCADSYFPDYTQRGSPEETQGGEEEFNKVLRGGSWSNMAFTSRCAERKKMNQSTRFNSVGFRCVKDRKP